MKMFKTVLWGLFFLFCIALVGTSQGGTDAVARNQKLTITLTVQEVEITLKGLSKLTYEECAAVIDNIRTQAVQQLTPPPSEQPKHQSDTTAGKKKVSHKPKKH